MGDMHILFRMKDFRIYWYTWDGKNQAVPAVRKFNHKIYVFLPRRFALAINWEKGWAQ